MSDGATSNDITNTNARDLITNMGISTGVNEVIIESPFEELQINGWEETWPLVIPTTFQNSKDTTIVPFLKTRESIECVRNEHNGWQHATLTVLLLELGTNERTLCATEVKQKDTLLGFDYSQTDTRLLDKKKQIKLLQSSSELGDICPTQTRQASVLATNQTGYLDSENIENLNKEKGKLNLYTKR